MEFRILYFNFQRLNARDSQRMGIAGIIEGEKNRDKIEIKHLQTELKRVSKTKNQGKKDFLAGANWMGFI